jgi:hypothetical protein
MVYERQHDESQHGTGAGADVEILFITLAFDDD